MFKYVVLLAFSVYGGLKTCCCAADLDGLAIETFAAEGVPCCDGLFGGGFIGDLVGSLTGESESSMYTGVFDGLNGEELVDITASSAVVVVDSLIC